MHILVDAFSLIIKILSNWTRPPERWSIPVAQYFDTVSLALTKTLVRAPDFVMHIVTTISLA